MTRFWRWSTSLIMATAFAVVASSADEGMWTFDNPPRAEWKARYGFDPASAWLDHLRLASLRLNDGGSASFVSGDGLIVTNQHVAGGQLQKVSAEGRDFVRDGFYARTRAEEIKCPDLEANVLVSYEDVTRRVQDAVGSATSDREVGAARRAAIANIEKESQQATGLRSDVVTLYRGGEYWLYRYKRYTDIRIVFAPEEQMAFFGGDYDNFTYPRYDLDIAFLRAYEDGRPARTHDYLRWSRSGASDGELVIVSGHPGSTDWLLTLTQVKYQRGIGNPLQRKVWEVRREGLRKYAELGTEQARQANEAIRLLDNSLKRLTGQQQGLENPRIMAAKDDEERALRTKIAANPGWQRVYADAWARLDEVYNELPTKAPRLAFSTLAPSRLGGYASTLVRYAEEIARPNESRLDEFRESQLESMRLSLLSNAPVYGAMEEAILGTWLEGGVQALGPDDPFVTSALDHKSATDVAHLAISATRLADPTERRTLLEGGPEAIRRSNDPLIALARRVEPVIRELRDWQDNRLRSAEASAGQKIAAARFAVHGKTLYPDATFTLRLGFGRALGYEEGTTLVPWKTTFYGLYDRAESLAEKPPFNLSVRWKSGRDRLNLATPLNFVYTVDTIGGNSGSPIVNANGELVGVNFDSNQQKLPNRYVYIDELEGGRAVGVHSSGILEALMKLYGAKSIVDELLR